MNLEAMRDIDPRNIDRGNLRQRSGVKIDPAASRQEKVRQLFEQINPYCYLDGSTVVISRFADTDVSITDCYCAYLGGV